MKICLTSLTTKEANNALARLRQAPGVCAVLNFAERQLQTGAMLDHTSGALLFGPNPTVAPFAFHVTVFPALSSAEIEAYERLNNVLLPAAYKDVLLHFNGLRAGDVALYGIFDFSYQKDPTADAAYVTFDVLREKQALLQQGRPYTHLFTFGSTQLPTSERGVLALTTDGAVLLLNQQGEALSRYSSVGEALEVEVSRALTELN